MSIETTDSKAVALYDTVTGIAFGPVFTGTDAATPADEAEAFLRWVTGNGWRASTLVNLPYKAAYGQTGMGDLAVAWQTMLTYHTEATCPFDRDAESYGVGFTGDSDVSHGDYTASQPVPCGCACHEKGVTQ